MNKKIHGEQIFSFPGQSVYEWENQWGGRNKTWWWFPQVRKTNKIKLKNIHFFAQILFSSATRITLNSEWCIWILQHGKEDGSLQWVGGWLADQDKRVPSGANIFLFKVLKKCCSSLFAGLILSHWIIFSPILRSERRWQQLRWFSVLATFQNFFTLDRNNVWWISSLHQIPIDCWTVRFLICFLLSIFHWFPHPAQPIQNCKYLVLVSVKIRVTEKC